MALLDITFDVPEKILQGLASGHLERVGGVVRNTVNKQIVMWLRDSNALDTALDLGSKFPTPLTKLFQAGRLGLSLWDSARSRGALSEVGQNVLLLNQSIEALEQQMSGVNQQLDQLVDVNKQISDQLASLIRNSGTVQVISAFTATGQILNLALTAASFAVTLQRLRQLSGAIADLRVEMRAQFERDRDMRFKTALQTARDVFESSNPKFREHAVDSAIQGLYEAREHFLNDFEDTLKQDVSSRDILMVAQHYYIRALYATIARIRCYLTTEDLKLAHDRLLEDLPYFRDAALHLVRLWVSQNSALFLHRSISTEDMNRFLQVQRWLVSPDDVYEGGTGKTLFDILDNLRSDFWRTEIVSEDFGSDLLRKVINRPVVTLEDRTKEMLNRLALAEAVIENYQRLLGFELEVRAMRLSSFADWTNMVDEDKLKKHKVAFIIDSEALDTLDDGLSA